jgi:hypothetical protein
MSKRMRLTLRKMIGSSLQFRRYDHEQHGVVETLTAESVIYVRPRFALAKPGDRRRNQSVRARTSDMGRVNRRGSQT